MPGRMEELLTDESSFEGKLESYAIVYHFVAAIVVGDEEIKKTYKRKAKCHDPSTYWEVHGQSIQCVAARAADELRASQSREMTSQTNQHDGRSASTKSANGPVKPSETNNQNRSIFKGFDNDPLAKHSGETLNQFFTRLPPSNTPRISGPWIWVASQHHTSRSASDRDVEAFVAAAHSHTSAYLSLKSDLQTKHPTKPAGSITRMLGPNRSTLEKAILDLARSHNVISGKWMLFPSNERLDQTWKTIAHAVFRGTLGPVAKVATADVDGNAGGDGKPRLICVYTEDFSDQKDVGRVLCELQKLGLVRDGVSHKEEEPRHEEEPSIADNIYYKCDAYTYLDIMSGNEYNLKASIYRSKDVFARMKQDTTA